MRLGPWFRLIRPGDCLSLALGLATVLALGLHFWSTDKPQKAEVRAAGRLVAELPLDSPRFFEVSGPLGLTRIEIQPGRARVASDPGPRQYCVRQGWLAYSGAVAICAPNEVSLAVLGRSRQYDSLGY